MELDIFLAELEKEQEWRDEEIRFLHNQLARYDIKLQDRFRRSIVVMLYAHFEGFTKFALQHYVRAINEENLHIADASHCVAAMAMSHLFKELRNPDKKNSHFKRPLPDDTGLHRFARDRDFVESFAVFLKDNLKIPEDAIDLESNLKPEVLKKNLFRLGLPYSTVDSVQGDINKLLGFRNGIAHGTFKDGIAQAKYDLCYQAVTRTTKFVKSTVYKAYREKAFLKAHSYY